MGATQMLQRYGDFSPTAFDSRGAFLPERRDWLVLPVMQTRDSGPLEQSNFAVALAMLGGESDNVEVHRFGHWGPGWFELILVNPDSPQATIADEIDSSIEDYPVLDEQDYSAREFEAASEYWASMSIPERVQVLQRFRGNIFEARHDYLPRSDNGELIPYLAGN